MIVNADQTPQMKLGSKLQQRIAGLDQLRFLMALIVAIGHCELAPRLEVSSATWEGMVARAVVHNLFNGPAAVIVFFVISGFCIHWPARGGRPLSLRVYFVRRWLRTLLPLAAALVLARPLGVALPLFENSILWSLVCEEIYYLLYPLHRRLVRRLGWRALIVMGYVAGALVACSNLSAATYHSFGWQFNWLVGLPCWLLGCWLAERADAAHQPIALTELWGWRLAVLAASMASSILRAHSPVNYPFTLNLVALLVFAWLKREIMYYRDHPPLARLEKAGGWSYSLYLTHLQAQAIYLLTPLSAWSGLAGWGVHLLFILTLAFSFSLLVEQPMHKFARWCSTATGG